MLYFMDVENPTPHFTPQKSQGYWGRFSVTYGPDYREWGRRTHGLGSRSGSLLDWLVDATGGDTVLIEVNNTKETHGYVYAEFWHVFFCMQPL